MPTLAQMENDEGLILVALAVVWLIVFALPIVIATTKRHPRRGAVVCLTVLAGAVPFIYQLTPLASIFGVESTGALIVYGTTLVCWLGALWVSFSRPRRRDG